MTMSISLEHFVTPPHACSSEDLAYAAGFIDGEGSITLNLYNVRGNPTLRPTISISNTNRDILMLLRQILGTGFISKTNRLKRPNHKDGFALQINSKWACRSVLKPLLPYLRLKQEQASLLLEFCQSIDRHNWRKNLAYSDRIWVIYEQIRQLNNRGRIMREAAHKDLILRQSQMPKITLHAPRGFLVRNRRIYPDSNSSLKMVELVKGNLSIRPRDFAKGVNLPYMRGYHILRSIRRQWDYMSPLVVVLKPKPFITKPS